MAVWASLSSHRLPKGHDSEMNEILPQLYLFLSVCWYRGKLSVKALLRHLLPTVALLEVTASPVKGHSQKTVCAHVAVILHSLAFSKQHWGKNYKACCSLEEDGFTSSFCVRKVLFFSVSNSDLQTWPGSLGAE